MPHRHAHAGTLRLRLVCTHARHTLRVALATLITETMSYTQGGRARARWVRPPETDLKIKECQCRVSSASVMKSVS